MTAASSATAKVIDVTPGLTVSPSGIPQVGALTAVPAVVTDGDSSASNVTYQWQRSTNDTTWNNIGGATGGSYTPTTADVNYDGTRRRVVFGRHRTICDGKQDRQFQSILHGTVFPGPPIAVFDTTTGQSVSAAGKPSTGPVSGLQWEDINITSDSLNISVSTPDWFIHSGSGNDAIAAK